MRSGFEGLHFQDAGRAETNLRLIEKRLAAKVWASLPTLLAQVPDPDASLNYLERFTAGAGPDIMQFLGRAPAAMDSLLTLFSYSNFLSESLVQQPELIQWLHQSGRRAGKSSPTSAGRAALAAGLERSKSREDYEADFEGFAATTHDLPVALVLARFKRREYLRITLRDVLGLATLAETTLELSHLADVLLENAVAGSERKLREKFGTPEFADEAGQPRPARLTILSLGKLGGNELNYSSDLDLMFLYSGAGETSGGPRKIVNAEYFVRLAQEVLRTISGASAEGAVFRVDLRLRPQGTEGDLTISFPAAREYYLRRARPWELQMLIKARASTGDVAAARNFLRALATRIFPPAGETPTREQFAAIEAVVHARQEITRKLRRGRPGGISPDHSAEWNIKLSPGGIRDIEFLTQCLQRVHGGSDAWLAAPAAASTLVALQRLHDKGHLSGRDFSRLADAYQFLRKIEHRLQLRDGLQRHTLPDAAAALDRLARRCGISADEAADSPISDRPGDLLKARIARHFAGVRELYERTVRPSQTETHEAPAYAASVGQTADAALAAMVREQYPGVARAAEAAPDAFARRGWQRFLSAAALDAGVMRELEAHPEWIGRCLELFSLSDLAVDWLARDPAEIRVLADPGLVGLRGSLAAIAHPAAKLEDRMSALRLAYSRSLLATVVRALSGASAPFDTFRELTRLAEEALRAALAAAAQDVAQVAELGNAPFAVLALGRLATGEMDIASDADLVFVAEEAASGASEQAALWRRVAERLVHIASSHTRDGILFPVDTRLRPQGGEGELLQTAARLTDYFSTQAQAWEAAPWIKARCVAGNAVLGARALTRVRGVLVERWGTPETFPAFSAELSLLRARMDHEGTGPRARTEFKHLPGGFYDIEYITTALYFRRLCADPARESREFGMHVLHQLEWLRAERMLDDGQAGPLREAAALFRCVDHAHRLITGRAPNRAPEPALAERLVRLLALWGVPLPSPDAAGLESGLSAARQNTRSVYGKIVMTGEAESTPEMRGV